MYRFCLTSGSLYSRRSAPIHDLKEAILKGKLGGLNPTPWAIQTGNCLGWCVYAYYTHDAYLLASNLPGLLVSLWLNMGAVKLQFLREHQEEMTAPNYFDYTGDEGSDDSAENNAKVILPQETLLLCVLAGWSWILIWVGWISPQTTSTVIGLMVNVNLIFFFGAPLQALAQVVKSGSSDCIHIPSMIMTVINTVFWLAYGFARRDPVIVVPNALGLMLGLCQVLLCLVYPADQTDLDEEETHNTSLDNGVGEQQLLMTVPPGATPLGAQRKHGHRRYYSTGNVRLI